MKGLCSNKERRNVDWKESRHPTNPQICKFFEKNEWADKYDKATGEMIYD
jgi:hypothetical protein